MLNMDWAVFCRDTLTGDVVAGCLGEGRDITYLNWIFSAWGWTVSVSLTALLLALVAGSLIGVIRTLPDSPGCASATPGSSCSATCRCWCRSSSGTTWCRR